MEMFYEDVYTLPNINMNFFWKGRDLYFHEVDPNGYLRVDGEFRNGKWGVSHLIKFKGGTFRIPKRFLKQNGNFR